MPGLLGSFRPPCAAGGLYLGKEGVLFGKVSAPFGKVNAPFAVVSAHLRVVNAHLGVVGAPFAKVGTLFPRVNRCLIAKSPKHPLIAMKRTLTLSLTAAIGCLLVTGYHSAHAAPTGVGIQFGQFSIPGYPNNLTPGYQTAPSGTLSDSRGYASSTSSGSSNAFAGFGALSVTVQHVSMDATLLNAFIYASAYFADTVTINAPGLTGQSGSLTYSFTLDGPLTANGATVDQEVFVDYGWGADAGDGSIPSMNFYFDFNGMRSLTGFSGGTNGLFVGVEQTETINFTYGTPFDFWLNIRARSDITTSEPGSVSATLSLTDWSGFENLMVGGSPVANATVTSVSGNDWTQPVPEPSTAALLVAGCGLAMAHRRRRR